jgi:protein SCO1
MSKLRFTCILTAVASGLLLMGCGPSELRDTSRESSVSEAQQFAVKGRVKGVSAEGSSITIEHEAIPGYMPAMTMPFQVKTPSEVMNLERGDAVGFRFHVTEDDSWIEQVRKLPDTAVAESPAREQASRTRVSARIPALEIGDVVPNFRLTNQAGERFQMSGFAGKHVVLTFIFTRCPVPNFCPLMSENFRQLRAMLDATPGGSDVQLLSITLDPEYDTPEMLRIYSARYTGDTSRWTFATGSAGEIDELTARFSIYAEPEGNTITHGLGTAQITPDGKLARVWRGNGWTAEEVFQAVTGNISLARNE